jgi:DNA-binding transcriptional MerR regulator
MLRSSRHHPRQDGGPSAKTADDVGDWLTVKEASAATGVPTSTIRKWARHDRIPSFLEQTSEGYLRVVSMEGIERWTEEIGRDIDSDAGEHELDLTAAEAAPESPLQVPPEGSMIVPLDAWNRMLNQLGNLHEAGQQLAEARERAAKAETEARFLKERLADLRKELETARRPPAADPAQETPASEPPSPTSVIKKAYDGWRAKRRRG